MSFPVQHSTQSEISQVLHTVKKTARITLGFVWLYQGIIPKLFTIVPMELDVVEQTGLYLISPRLTMFAIGVVEIFFGVWLISGYRERLACMITTLFLLVLSALVLIEEPSLLIGPFGGLIKNICLFTCAWIVWQLSLHTDN